MEKDKTYRQIAQYLLGKKFRYDNAPQAVQVVEVYIGYDKKYRVFVVELLTDYISDDADQISWGGTSLVDKVEEICNKYFSLKNILAASHNKVWGFKIPLYDYDRSVSHFTMDLHPENITDCQKSLNQFPA